MVSIVSENRPWNFFSIIKSEKTNKLKLTKLNTGERLSYEFHYKRSEGSTILEDLGKINLDGKTKVYGEGEMILIPQGVKHNIKNNEKDKVVHIKVQTGTYFGEDDIVRIEDNYNRR